MSIATIPVVDFAVDATLSMLGLAALLAFLRLVRGPSLLDRVVALDLISTIAVGMIAVYAVHTREQVFLLVAVVLALIAFLGTVAFAYYIQRGGSP